MDEKEDTKLRKLRSSFKDDITTKSAISCVISDEWKMITMFLHPIDLFIFGLTCSNNMIWIAYIIRQRNVSFSSLFICANGGYNEPQIKNHNCSHETCLMIENHGCGIHICWYRLRRDDIINMQYDEVRSVIRIYLAPKFIPYWHHFGENLDEHITLRGETCSHYEIGFSVKEETNIYEVSWPWCTFFNISSKVNEVTLDIFTSDEHLIPANKIYNSIIHWKYDYTDIELENMLYHEI